MWWLAAGVFGGLALDSKYTALLLWIGVGAVGLAGARRPALAAPLATLGGLRDRACLLFAPVLALERDARLGRLRQARRPRRGLAAGPGDRLSGGIDRRADRPGDAAGVGAVHGRPGGRGAATPGGRAIRRWSLLAALSLPPVLVFVQHAFGDRVQGNWPAIIYPALAVAAGGMALRRRWWIGASALGFAITALAYVQAATSLIPLPPRLDPIAMRLAGGTVWPLRSRHPERPRARILWWLTDMRWTASWPGGLPPRSNLLEWVPDGG